MATPRKGDWWAPLTIGPACSLCRAADTLRQPDGSLYCRTCGWWGPSEGTATARVASSP